MRFVQTMVHLSGSEVGRGGGQGRGVRLVDHSQGQRESVYSPGQGGQIVSLQSRAGGDQIVSLQSGAGGSDW